MVTLAPFRALRPVPETAADVVSVPYDIVEHAEAVRLAEGNPLSFLHVIRPDIDLPPEMDPYADEAYQVARENLENLRHRVPFLLDETPGFYVYRLTYQGQTQTAFVGCASVDEYDEGRIKKHEETRPMQEEDRKRLLLTLSAQTGPVFLIYRRTDILTAITEAITSEEELLYDFATPDGIHHQVWRVPDAEAVSDAFRAVSTFYIADGHHRASSASRARKRRRELNPSHSGNEAYNYFLVAAFPADELHILPYNRVVHDLGDQTPEEFLARLGGVCEVQREEDVVEPARKREVGIYLEDAWYRVTLPEPEGNDPVARLDANILQEVVLEPLLEIDDPSTSSRITFVGGVHGVPGLIEQVRSRPGTGVAFNLHPVSVDDVLTVADAGRLLPPKCTWFEPKLKSGLFVHLI